ncbi:hypothetical protein [Azospirillum canadense]|uniref:hypothetical protein n=1 Tax=Azospirillum canadense TaxID=403962 RepID=UPI003872AB75|nr:transposase [Azospirillum canadense]
MISRIGMDTSKHVLHRHGVDAAERPVLRKALRRKDTVRFFERLPPTRIGVEDCGGSHRGARLLGGFGHEVRLIPVRFNMTMPARRSSVLASATAIFG